MLTVLLAALAFAGLWGRRLNGFDTDGRRSGARWECLVGAATLVIGLLVTVLTNSAYEVRYASVVFPFFALAAGRGVALIGRPLRIVALVLIAALGVSISVRAIDTPRTQAGQIAAAIRSRAHKGDVVVYCPISSDQIPVACCHDRSRFESSPLQDSDRPPGWTGSTTRCAIAVRIRARSRGN